MRGSAARGVYSGLAVALALMIVRPGPGRAQDPARITVFAAASLKDAFTDMAARLGMQHPPVLVQFNFGGSQQLVLQLQQGAKADLFASADQHWMEVARESGLVAGAAPAFARNRLVVITPAANPGRVDRLEDLSRRGVKLVLAAAPVPAGRYARESLAQLAAAPGFGADYPARVLRNVVSQEENVKAVVSKVQLGEADAGMVYVSDVTRTVRRDVRVIEIPDEYNVVAAYPIAVLAGAGQPGAARAFEGFVRSREGQAILARHGFLPAEAQAAAGAPR